jgi:hypothetical protein
MVSLHFMHYNFCRIHSSLRVTPAMAAGVTSRLWSAEDIVDLLDAAGGEPKKRGTINRANLWEKFQSETVPSSP